MYKFIHGGITYSVSNVPKFSSKNRLFVKLPNGSTFVVTERNSGDMTLEISLDAGSPESIDSILNATPFHA